MATIENVVNQALDLIGYADHVGNIYEGTKASVIALAATRAPDQVDDEEHAPGEINGRRCF